MSTFLYQRVHFVYNFSFGELACLEATCAHHAGVTFALRTESIDGPPLRSCKRAAGESSLIELVTIVTLSVFLFYSSFLSEVQQLMQQVTLSCCMRCYEGAMAGEFASGASSALAEAIHKTRQTATFWSDTSHLLLLLKRAICYTRFRDDVVLYCVLAGSDVACEAFMVRRRSAQRSRLSVDGDLLHGHSVDLRCLCRASGCW